MKKLHRKLLTLPLLLLLTVNLSAGFCGHVEYGHATDQQIQGYNIAYIDIDFQLYYNWYITPYIGGGVKTWYCENYFKNYPFRSIYDIYSGVEYKGFYVQVYHLCNHATYSPMIDREWERNKWVYDMTMIQAGYKWDLK